MSTQAKLFALVDAEGKIGSSKLYNHVGAARGVLTRLKNDHSYSKTYEGWTVKQVRTVTIQDAPVNTVDLTEGSSYGTVYRQPRASIDVVTDEHVVRVHKDGHVEYTTQTVTVY